LSKKNGSKIVDGGRLNIQNHVDDSSSEVNNRRIQWGYYLLTSQDANGRRDFFPILSAVTRELDQYQRVNDKTKED
jgi:hypothetical protein